MDGSADPGRTRAVIGAAALITLLLVVPSTSGASHEFKEWRPLGEVEWGAVENPAIGINHAVILFDGHIVDDSDRARRFSYSRYNRVRVFDAKGADDFRTVELPYAKPWKFSRIMARTVKPSGEVIDVRDEGIHEKTLVSIGKSKIRAKVFAFKGVEPGDIVEFIYTMRGDDISPPLVQLQNPAYTIEARLRWYYYPQPYAEDFINATSELLDVLTYRSVYVIPNGRSHGGTVTPFGKESAPDGIDVLFRNLPGLPDEPYKPPDRAVAVLFAAHYEWPRLEAKQPFWEGIAEIWGSSTREFLEQQRTLGPWMKEIIAHPRSLDEDLAACVELAHREIRNADLLDDDELPEKVPDPNSIDELIEHRIGRGEQIDYLVAAMLKRLGYQATVFWARDHEEGPFIPEWKSSGQFTISGVAIRRDANRIQFCVPHLTAVSPMAVPWEICGSKAMMEDLSDDRSFSDFPPLCDIPMAIEDGNRTDLEVVLRMGEEGRLNGRLKARWECLNEPLMLQSLSDDLRKSRKDALTRLKGWALRPGIEWTAFEESLAVGNGAMAYSCSLQVDGLVEEAGGMSLVDLGALRIDDYSLPEGPRRTNLDFHHPRHYTSNVELILAPGQEVSDLAPPERFTDRVADFRSSCTQEGGHVRLQRDLQIHYGLFLPAAAEPFREFFRTIYKATEQPTVIRAAGAE